MMSRFKNKWKKAFSLILCVIIAVNSNVLSVYATEGDDNETSDDPIIIVSILKSRHFIPRFDHVGASTPMSL